MATKTETVTAPVTREILPIPLRSIILDQVTHTRKYLIVEVDPSLTLQDFNDHADTIWRLVQQDRAKALAPNDVVELRAAEWTAFAVVNSIDGNAVYLYDVRRAQRPQRTVALFEDSTYRIGQVGTRFSVYHKLNGNPNPHGGQTFETIEGAKAFLLSQYPRKVA